MKKVSEGVTEKVGKSVQVRKDSQCNGPIVGMCLI